MSRESKGSLEKLRSRIRLTATTCPASAGATSAAAIRPRAALIFAAEHRHLHPAAENTDVANDHAIALVESRQHFRLPDPLVDHAELNLCRIDGAIGDAIHERLPVLLRLTQRRTRHDDRAADRPLNHASTGERSALERTVAVRDRHIYRDGTGRRIDR